MKWCSCFVIEKWNSLFCWMDCCTDLLYPCLLDQFMGSIPCCTDLYHQSCSVSFFFKGTVWCHRRSEQSDWWFPAWRLQHLLNNGWSRETCSIIQWIKQDDIVPEREERQAGNWKTLPAWYAYEYFISRTPLISIRVILDRLESEPLSLRQHTSLHKAETLMNRTHWLIDALLKTSQL